MNPGQTILELCGLLVAVLLGICLVGVYRAWREYMEETKLPLYLALARVKGDSIIAHQCRNMWHHKGFLREIREMCADNPRVMQEIIGKRLFKRVIKEIPYENKGRVLR